MRTGDVPDAVVEEHRGLRLCPEPIQYDLEGEVVGLAEHPAACGDPRAGELGRERPARCFGLPSHVLQCLEADDVAVVPEKVGDAQNVQADSGVLAVGVGEDELAGEGGHRLEQGDQEWVALQVLLVVDLAVVDVLVPVVKVDVVVEGIDESGQCRPVRRVEMVAQLVDLVAWNVQVGRHVGFDVVAHGRGHRRGVVQAVVKVEEDEGFLMTGGVVFSHILPACLPVLASVFVSILCINE